MQLNKTKRYNFLMFELFSTLTVLESVITEKKLPYILVYKSNACISRTLFLKPKIQLF